MLQKYITRMKPWLFVMILSLTACTEGTPKPSANVEDPPPIQEEVTTPAPEEGDGNEEPGGSAPESTRPEVETFELLTGEGNQTLTANLHQGEGFSLYVFEHFGFDVAEGRLYLNSNPEYHVQIEKLSADQDLSQLIPQARDELAAFGEVSDYSGELIEHPLGFAEIYLQASSEKGIQDYIVWKSATGEAFRFLLHNPKGEEAPEFAAPVMVSLATVQSES